MKLDNGIARYDENDPEDLAVLIKSGLIWKGGPKTQQKAIEALLNGDVPRPANLPPAVAAYLDSQLDEYQPAPVTDDELAEAPAADEEEDLAPPAL